MSDGKVDQKLDKPAVATVGTPPGLGGELLTHPASGTIQAERPLATNPVQGGKLAFNDGDLFKNTLRASDQVVQAADTPPPQGLNFWNKGVSQDTQDRIIDAVGRLPASVKNELAAKGTQIYAFKDIREYDKFFGTHNSELVVDGNRLAAADAASLNEPNAHPPRIAIFEQTMNGEPIKKHDDIGGLTRHELGHILTNPMIPNQNLDNNWDRDLAQIVSAEAARVPNNLRTGLLSHYFHGPAEIYAETFAISQGGGGSQKEDAYLRQYFPKTIQYLRNKYPQ